MINVDTLSKRSDTSLARTLSVINKRLERNDFPSDEVRAIYLLNKDLIEDEIERRKQTKTVQI